MDDNEQDYENGSSAPDAGEAQAALGRTAALQAKIDALNLEVMDDLMFQANYKEMAAKIPIDKVYLKKAYREKRNVFMARISAARRAQNEDPWADAPFIPLGIRGTDPVLFSKSSSTIVTGSSKHALLFCAPDSFYREIAPAGKSGARIDWDRAESQVLERAKRAGPFDINRARARGAWLDQIGGKKDRLVLNVGDLLIVEGETMPLGPAGKYIYTSGVAIDLPAKLSAAATVADAEPIFTLYRALKWRNPDIDPLLLLGFVVVSQIGGALKWRPSIWLNGSSQAGKTTLLDRGVNPLMQFTMQRFGTGSTEAGIRQTLAGDSLPWLYDEAEPSANLSRMQRVMALLRGNSSAAGDERSVKGTISGHPLFFELRSCALLSSVAIATEQSADVSRLTSIELIRSEGEDYRTNIEPQWSGITAALGQKIFARIVNHWSDLRDHIELFKPVVEKHTHAARGADQLGTLLAGAFFLQHDGKATQAQAAEWLGKIKDWGDHARGDLTVDGDEADERQCLNSILSAHVDVQVENHHEKRSIGELVEIACGTDVDVALGKRVCDDTLGRYGIRIEESGLWVANRHAALHKLLDGQPWASNWRALLRRLPGAEAGDGPKKFAGVVSRYVSVPLSLLLGEEKE